MEVLGLFMILLKYGKQENSQFSIKKYFIASWANTGRCLKIKRTKSIREPVPAGLPEFHQKTFFLFFFFSIQSNALQIQLSPLCYERTSLQRQCIQHIADSVLPIVIMITAARAGAHRIKLMAVLWPAAGDRSLPAA